jgi:hemerythrin-like domain-containing protein
LTTKNAKHPESQIELPSRQESQPLRNGGHQNRRGDRLRNCLHCADNRHMLRDKNLIPLSHQHQHCLALCVRLDRAIQAGEVDLDAWQAEIQQVFEQEITFHFAAEEKELFPAAARFPELQPLVRELLTGHALLRNFFSRAAARTLHIAGLQALVEKLASHIRKEERELFEGMQNLMTPEELAVVGAALQQSLADASNACILPNAATKLRPKQ